MALTIWYKLTVTNTGSGVQVAINETAEKFDTRCIPIPVVRYSRTSEWGIYTYREGYIDKIQVSRSIFIAHQSLTIRSILQLQYSVKQRAVGLRQKFVETPDHITSSFLHFLLILLPDLCQKFRIESVRMPPLDVILDTIFDCLRFVFLRVIRGLDVCSDRGERYLFRLGGFLDHGPREIVPYSVT